MAQTAKERLFAQIDSFYNKDQKAAFVEYYEKNFNLNYSASLIADVFSSAALWEPAVGKDVCDFSLIEYESMFVGAEWYKKTYFNAVKSLIKSYSEWCKENGYSNKIELEITFVRRPEILKQIIKSVFPFKTSSEFIHFYENVFQMNDPDYRNANAMRYCSVLLAWDGLEKSEIFNLSKEDIVGNKAYLKRKKEYEKRELVLSDKTLEIIDYCNRMTSVKVRNKGGRFSEYNLNSSNQVIRAANYGRGSINTQSIETNYGKIIRRMIDESVVGKTMPYKFSYQNVMYNGILVRAVETNDLSEVNSYDLKEDFEAFVGYYNS